MTMLGIVRIVVTKWGTPSAKKGRFGTYSDVFGDAFSLITTH